MSSVVIGIDGDRDKKFRAEKGYTQIPNDLLDAIMLAGLTKNQILVFLAIARKTHGYNKKSDWISNFQLSELTGISPHKCSAAKSALLKRKILFSSGRFIGINQSTQEWQDKINSNESNLPKLGKKSLPETGKHNKQTTINKINIYPL